MCIFIEKDLRLLQTESAGGIIKSRLYSQLGPEQALSQVCMYKTYNIGGQQKNKTNIETKQKQTIKMKQKVNKNIRIIAI